MTQRSLLSDSAAAPAAMELGETMKTEDAFKSLLSCFAPHWPPNRPPIVDHTPHGLSHSAVMARCSLPTSAEHWASIGATEAIWRLARSVVEDNQHSAAVNRGSGNAAVLFGGFAHAALGRARPSASPAEIEKLRRLVGERELGCNGARSLAWLHTYPLQRTITHWRSASIS